MGFLSKRCAIGIRWIARVRTMVVRVWPFGRIGLAHGSVEGVVRIRVACAVVGIAPRRLGEPGGGLLWSVVLVV
jgi:hypothetical protein